MHSIINGGRAFKSAYTKKLYEHDGSEQGRRAARDQMEADHKRYREANDARSMQERGRPCTEREYISGWHVDNRTIRERVQQDGIVTSQTKHDPAINQYKVRLTQLEQEYKTAGPHRKAAIKRRIERLKLESAERDGRYSEEIERQQLMESDAVSDARFSAVHWLEKLQMTPDVPQAWLKAAKDRLDALEESGDAKQYQQNLEAWKQERDQHIADKLAALKQREQEAHDLQTEIRSSRRADDVDFQKANQEKADKMLAQVVLEGRDPDQVIADAKAALAESQAAREGTT